jgi:hypothetical protein
MKRRILSALTFSVFVFNCTSSVDSKKSTETEIESPPKYLSSTIGFDKNHFHLK